MSKQKIDKLLIGTNNKGKLREIKILLPKSIKIHSTSEFNLKSPVENGKTFKENSLIKSKYFSKKTGLMCLADDSGLEIDFLEKYLDLINEFSLNVFPFSTGLFRLSSGVE
jgi:XTP/dITP diphosphohydrolase